MFALSVDATLGSAELERDLDRLYRSKPAWVLSYAPAGTPLTRLMSAVRRRHPKLPVFGATSFQGVFTADGFSRNAGLLVVEDDDAMPVAVSLCETGPANAEERAHKACLEIRRALGAPPQVLLLHATPGFEERILAGIRAAFGTDVPVYGGSAADDSISGEWEVFANGACISQGFMLAGISSSVPPLGAFLGGYLPTEHVGTVTRVDGRTVFEIDGAPAARVYNTWVRGAIAEELEHGGSVLLKTNLMPVARTIASGSALPQRLLSHPHEVIQKNQALNFFSEFGAGDVITLMTSSLDPLVKRVARTVQRARAGAARPVRGGLLVYCGGCLGALLPRAPEIAQEFAKELGDLPFVGVATFGEQGRFFDKTESRHGNLMCTVLLF